MSDADDVKAISKVILRGSDWAIGPEIEQFEEMLAKYVGSDYCLTFNSGTSALHAALLVLNLKIGSEILVPSFTFIATVNSVLMVNAKPKFVDIEEKTYGLDPVMTKASVTNKTSAIMPIHYAGLPCQIEEIADISKRKKIYLIEDAAQALGAKVKKRMVGTFGDLAIFSFAGNKVLTTGEGGCITTNSKQLYEKLKLLRSHGRKDKQSYFSSITKPEYVTIGYNWRMSSITAALGISQMKKIEKLIRLRRNHAKYLSSRLSKFEQIVTPKESEGNHHVFQLYSIKLNNSKIRDGLMKFLSQKGIMSKVFFHPVHLTKFYKNLEVLGKNNLSHTENVSNQILTLPMYPSLKKEDLNYICGSISEFMEKTQIDI